MQTQRVHCQTILAHLFLSLRRISPKILNRQPSIKNVTFPESSRCHIALVSLPHCWPTGERSRHSWICSAWTLQRFELLHPRHRKNPETHDRLSLLLLSWPTDSLLMGSAHHHRWCTLIPSSQRQYQDHPPNVTYRWRVIFSNMNSWTSLRQAIRFCTQRDSLAARFPSIHSFCGTLSCLNEIRYALVDRDELCK